MKAVPSVSPHFPELPTPFQAAHQPCLCCTGPFPTSSHLRGFPAPLPPARWCGKSHQQQGRGPGGRPAVAWQHEQSLCSLTALAGGRAGDHRWVPAGARPRALRAGKAPARWVRTQHSGLAFSAEHRRSASWQASTAQLIRIESKTPRFPSGGAIEIKIVF